MEREESDGRSDLLNGRAESNLESSPPILTENSPSVGGAAVGEAAGKTLSFIDALLTMLQSQLGEIRDAGVNVRLFQKPEGLAILIEAVSICPNHQMMHSGKTCPGCL